MNEHKPGCMANMRCAVYHPDGICPGPYGKCTCASIKENVITPTLGGLIGIPPHDNKTEESWAAKTQEFLRRSGWSHLNENDRKRISLFITSIVQDTKKKAVEEVIEWAEKNYEFPNGKMDGAWIPLNSLKEALLNNVKED